MIRLAYLVTHPIQYQAPFLRALAQEPDIALTVFFASAQGAEAYLDPDFGQRFAWDQDLLAGYAWEVLCDQTPAPPVTAWRPFPRGFGVKLRQGRFDVLWLHGYSRPHHLLSLWQAKRSGIKVVIRDEVNAISRPRSALKKLLKKPLLRWVTGSADALFAIGQYNAAFWQQAGAPPDRIHAVPYGIDNDRFRQAAEVARQDGTVSALHKAWGLPSGTGPNGLDRPVFLFLGKLIPRKDPAVILDALAELPADRRPHMIFVGDGPQRADLEAFVEARGLNATDGTGARVLFDGFQNQTDLPGRIAASDCLILPSREEAWGLVVNEAMSCGLPALVSDRVSCAPDLILPGRTGWTFPAGNAKALAASLIAASTALADPDQVAEMRNSVQTQVATYDTTHGAALAATALRILCAAAER
ncbi:MAG: glycosyltransferase [Rhodospirillaceae bacterium]